MRKLIGITLAIFLTSSLLFVTVCAGAGPVDKPLKAKWIGTTYTIGYCPTEPRTYKVINVGSGVASGPLGSSNFVFVYCVAMDFTDGYGWGIITTANGDKLHLWITNLALDTSEFPVIKWSEKEEIVGGTGMFENASGGSESGGTWTSEADPFPEMGPPPQLLLPAQGWVGTTKGVITF